MRQPGRSASQGSDLPAWTGLIPVAGLIAIFAINWADRPFYQRWMLTERGVIENLTFACAFGAALAAAVAARRAGAAGLRLSALWLALLALACVYFAGEEISWGQQWFRWTTPGWVGELNRQDETNLHNMLPLFDNLPRVGLELWIAIGGILVPLWKRRGTQVWPEPLVALFWPTLVCLPTALCVLATRVPNLVYGDSLAVPAQWRIDGGEVKELFCAVFLLVYALSATCRLAAAARGGGSLRPLPGEG